MKHKTRLTPIKRRWRKQDWSHYRGARAAVSYCSANHKGIQKQRYKTREEALAAVVEKHEKWRVNYAVYRCGFCSDYHLTSKT